MIQANLGFQVAPAELEGLLLGHPEVKDVAVIGSYSTKDATELPRAYIVLRAEPSNKEDQDKKATELVAYIQQRVAPHKRLRGGVAFVSAIPKLASGKILRKDVRLFHQEEQKKGVNSKL